MFKMQERRIGCLKTDCPGSKSRALGRNSGRSRAGYRSTFRGVREVWSNLRCYLLACGLIHLPTGLAELNGACYFPRMSTLSEIEAAVDKLPRPEQKVLLEHLARNLAARPPITEGLRAQRERWLQKLDRLRSRGSTGKTGVPLQEILDDIRAERC